MMYGKRIAHQTRDTKYHVELERWRAKTQSPIASSVKAPPNFGVKLSAGCVRPAGRAG